MEIDFDKLMEIKNSMPEKDFEGLSPAQMSILLYELDNEDILQINDTLESIDEIPIVKSIFELIKLIDPEKGTKLTNTGNLPVKIVKEIYSKGIIKDKYIEAGITKLSKETDAESIHCTKIIGLLSGYLRITNNRIFVTKKGKNFEKDRSKLKKILNTFGSKFNLGYFDGYENSQIGQHDFKFSLYLLYKFGEKEREKNFYANKYFTAFPMNGDCNERNKSCYTLRTFQRFFNYFGIIEQDKTWNDPNVKITNLFKKYITFKI